MARSFDALILHSGETIDNLLDETHFRTGCSQRICFGILAVVDHPLLF